MRKIVKLIVVPLIAIVAIWALWVAYKWTVMRVYVGPNKALLVINKFGKPLPADRLTVPAGQDDYRGTREEVRGPGRYFLNPIFTDWELVDLVEIPAGEPQDWEWDALGNLKDPRTAPMLGLVKLEEGKNAPEGTTVVENDQYKGLQREVLTPGTYRTNPKRMNVTKVPAVVVPPGSVGVVTRLVENIGPVASAPLAQAAEGSPSTQPAGLVIGAVERGILKDVLQPGIYYLNPRLAKVTIVPVGYDAITLEAPKNAVTFYTSDGYQADADFTVVWGRTPTDAPHIVASIGTADLVRQNVIEPAMKAACQNLGAKYSALMLIQGQTRSQFQDELEKSLKEQVASRNIDVPLTLIRNIAIKDKVGKDATEGLLATIQRANIEVERNETNKQKTLTATVKANLEQANKLVDVAKETVSSETNVKVATLMAEGTKKAAEIDAQRDVRVAEIMLEVAQLEAQRTEIMGKATAETDRLKNDAEAKGAKMLVDALGSPEAYNRYIFAKNFQPRELKMIFAGPGTFWTDLKSFQDAAAGKVLQPAGK